MEGTIYKVDLVKKMIEIGELIVFDERSKTLYDENDLTVSMNGDSIQIFIKHRAD